MKKYKWKEGAGVHTPAQVAGEVCASLEEAGMLTPSNLVDVSRPEDAPLHREFEWDDSVAAEKFREQQARVIIGHLAIVVDEETKHPVRAFVQIEENNSNYEDIHVVVKTEDKYEKLLKMAKRDMMIFKNKYSMLQELSGVFKAMEEVA